MTVPLTRLLKRHREWCEQELKRVDQLAEIELIQVEGYDRISNRIAGKVQAKDAKYAKYGRAVLTTLYCLILRERLISLMI